MRSPHFTEEHEQFRRQLRRFVSERITPFGEEWEREQKIPRELFREMGELGFLGVRFPEELGGSDMGMFGLLVLAEELARSTWGGVTVAVMVHTAMASPHLLTAGTPEQLERYAEDLIMGRKVCGIAVSEPEAGSDVAGMRTRAWRDGDDWVINGSKFWITNGAYGDVFFVAARTDPDSRGARGLSMFIVEKGTPGFSVGRRLEKMGDWCSDTAELIFDNVRVPQENLLGEEGKGFYSVMKNFQSERIALGGMSTGEASVAMKRTIDYLRERVAFGSPLIEKQAIRLRLAELHAKLEAAKQLTYYAAWLHDNGLESAREVSMVKALCPEVTNEVMYACQQYHGGMGYIREGVIERMVRDARLHAIGGGATEVMLEEIAKRWHDVPYWD
ncbi:acyl-CoA dehydrogenase [Oceanicola sp. 22II-s10i]|uniref:acyl-CoA dehydrogenase family protein n=1 Tax=Oceanicola sp. 22II-s10i TaxID=1317116 RepID=UPI000B52501A|nr:acyl-CoA dehydrogenase family protein [Oceanicola sp. 22II-s10i]OWU83143.1 acyl-CoA dehydrogenase [Oceanicola sp. 22II-s10i]